MTSYPTLTNYFFLPTVDRLHFTFDFAKLSFTGTPNDAEGR